MTFLLKTIEKTVALLKRDKDYKIHLSYTLRQLLAIIYYRSLQVLRGFWLRLKFQSSEGLVFCGRSVIVEHAYQIKVGSNLILEDRVIINALSDKGIVLGRNVTIGKNTIISCTGVIANKGIGVTVGDYSAIGANSFLGGQGGITIGNNVIMGPGIKVFSENHNYSHTTVIIRKQGETRKGIIIEDNCWIGGGTIILDGTTIGSGTIIAAGAVVTKSIPENSIAAGVPARVIKSRIGKESVNLAEYQ